MKIIFLLIIVSLIVALGFLGAFLWAVRSGQYDDDYSPAVRILFDEDGKAGGAPSHDTTLQQTENNHNTSKS
ncbi:MAG: cbb3-type cytochrome oxidase assembly protein CcoS [Phaeodactylibacter sp.]|nr:cbb3-type cytochrome oxidase assembly protein CcoS [Phaeodactylibacter sp.]MCB9297265.1 cbb3-type cytochrome oxidase assembly protein CcoS [Lewinellaceae bacterium]